MEYITDLINQLLGAKTEVVALLGVIAVGYALRMLPFVPNKYIPALCWLLGTLAYCLLKPVNEVPATTAHPLVWKIVVGFILSFVAWTLHKAAIKPIEDKFPWLKTFFDAVSGESVSDKTPDGTK
jgi:hypothetical protein